MARNRFTKEAWSLDKMYSMLHLNPDAYEESLFEWINPMPAGSTPCVFTEDCVVSAVPTGNQAGRSINLPAKNNPVGYDLVVITLINDRYVNDVSSGTRRKLPMKRYFGTIIEILEHEGFITEFIAVVV